MTDVELESVESVRAAVIARLDSESSFLDACSTLKKLGIEPRDWVERFTQEWLEARG